MKYFSGPATDLGTVTALPFTTFAELRPWLEKPASITLSRAAYAALDARERSIAKRVAYLTPAAFNESPSSRKTENVARCHLLALDIDDPEEAQRLLVQGWEVLGTYAFVAWHTASSTPEAPRIRVIVSADGLASSRYPAAVKTIAEILGLRDVTHESLVPVQPMFLPSVFADDTRSPIIAAHFKGEAFTASDILDLAEEGHRSTAENESVDLTFLQRPMDGVTLVEAKAALQHLDPDCSMQEWIETGAGLKHQFQGNDREAYALWDEWSARGKKYVDTAETTYRWSTLKAQPVNRSPVTIRSVLRRAVARGWTNPQLSDKSFASALAWLNSPSLSTEQLQDEGFKRIAQAGPLIRPMERSILLENIRSTLKRRGLPLSLVEIKRHLRTVELEEARTTGVPPWATGICFVTALNKFYRPVVDRRFSPEVIDLMFTAPLIGDDKMRVRDYLTKVVGIPQVENLRYDPQQGTKRYMTIEGVPFVNTYRACSVKADLDRADEAGAIYQMHLNNLVLEAENRQIFTDYFAFLHQHPGVKIRWSPLLQSTKGAGKTFFAVMLTATLGRRNVKKIDPAIVMDSKHNDWASGSQIIVMEEVRIVGQNRHAVMDRLKPCITDDEICVRAMYEPPKTVPNITNYLMFTNHHDALAIQDDERRYFIVSSPLQKLSQIEALGGASYFAKIYDAVRDNTGGFRAFFENWPISSAFNPEGRAPATTYFHELVDTAASPLTAAVKQTIEDEPSAGVRKDILSMASLMAELQSQKLPPYSEQSLGQIMRELGWFKDERFGFEGVRHQLWTRDLWADGAARKQLIARIEVL